MFYILFLLIFDKSVQLFMILSGFLYICKAKEEIRWLVISD